MKKDRIVGISINTKSLKYKDKIYYYKTDKELVEGDKIEVKMPTGGLTDCIVVEADNKNIHKLNLKELEFKK